MMRETKQTKENLRQTTTEVKRAGETRNLFRSIYYKLSRTQVNITDVTRIVKEIRDIKEDQKLHRIGGPLNKIKELSKHLSNTPDLDQGKRGEGDRDDVETDYNRLCPSPPTDSCDTQTRHDEAQIPDLSKPSQTPPAPSPDRTPSVSAARTSSLPSEDVELDPEVSPSVESTASGSPDSPDELKASSLVRK